MRFETPGQSSFYSVDYLVQLDGQAMPYLLAGTVGRVGSERIAVVAVGILADFDEHVEYLTRFISTKRE